MGVGAADLEQPSLGDAVRTWAARYGQRAWMRPLEGTIERHHEDALMKVIERFDGRPFPTTPGLGVDFDEDALRARAYQHFPDRRLRTPADE